MSKWQWVSTNGRAFLFDAHGADADAGAGAGAGAGAAVELVGSIPGTLDNVPAVAPAPASAPAPAPAPAPPVVAPACEPAAVAASARAVASLRRKNRAELAVVAAATAASGRPYASATAWHTCTQCIGSQRLVSRWKVSEHCGGAGAAKHVRVGGVGGTLQRDGWSDAWQSNGRTTGDMNGASVSSNSLSKGMEGTRARM